MAGPSGTSLGLVQRDGGGTVAAGALGVEPRVDVALPEAPLSPDPDGRNLPGLDQTIDRAQIDLEVFQDLLGRQEDLVAGEVGGH